MELVHVTGRGEVILFSGRGILVASLTGAAIGRVFLELLNHLIHEFGAIGIQATYTHMPPNSLPNVK